MYYSQFKQDEVVYNNFFKDKTNGYFVDIGAHNGIEFSNSKFFEEIGWTGVCVEPNPVVFEQLQSVRSCKCVQKAVADRIGIAQFFQILEGADMLSGLVDEFTQKGIETINANLQDFENGFAYIDVELDLFDNIVDQTTIDYLSIDTEGNEMKILETIDFNKYDIKVMTIENNEYDNRFIDYLTPKGYKFAGRLGCDELYFK